MSKSTRRASSFVPVTHYDTPAPGIDTTLTSAPETTEATPADVGTLEQPAAETTENATPEVFKPSMADFGTIEQPVAQGPSIALLTPVKLPVHVIHTTRDMSSFVTTSPQTVASLAAQCIAAGIVDRRTNAVVTAGRVKEHLAYWIRKGKMRRTADGQVSW